MSLVNKIFSIYKFTLFFLIILLNYSCSNSVYNSQEVKHDISVEVINCGIYELAGDYVLIPDSTTATGYAAEAEYTESTRLIESTDRVPLTKGFIFGCNLNINGLRDGQEVPIATRVTHPSMINPSGKIFAEFYLKTIVKQTKKQSKGGIHFMFSEDYELVSGVWVFEVLQEKNILFKKLFYVGMN